ncbi:ABC-2 family transporter protein [Pseudobythopirellula maris]|uniref:ABC-2 family transporter protein n=1 Tax=Pseudobythopirellula maris TaxID=2527991 RepID=A0A5C5ZRA1_9BACT|nr:ABC transporter permease subunit/CPBP intramembrane protease [Pseudobythopirellula maris]TWT90029.1 ABC-2 family transporter protein [Pseudobythopirellula maris]
MNWRNTQLIWFREMRDQVRDRRTLFMVVVLPLLLYPLLGMSFLQLSQFMRQTKAKAWLVGAEQLDSLTGVSPLVEGERFSAEFFDSPLESDLLSVSRAEQTGPNTLTVARARVASGEVDVVLYFPEDFAARLQALRDRMGALNEGESPLAVVAAAPKPMVIYSTAREASQVAQLRVRRVLDRWQQRIVQQNLAVSRVPIAATRPFEVDPIDIASVQGRQAVVWSKLLPFIVFLWALTGAFYPAVDLCAGEKERGTLETLLASPAGRTDIVFGKLLTVMTFSILTAMLNLICMGATGRFVIPRLLGAAGAGGLGDLALPSPWSLLWLLLAMLPVSALFGALSLACASFARSTKEGQYYFMPLFMGLMPLLVFPTMPGIELNLGTSLAPVMGLVLLMRALIEGQYAFALTYTAPVVGVTLLCCFAAVRWAVAQFNQESVLFRESERFDLRAWLVGLVRRRDDTPTPAAAVVCVASILIVQFFVQMLLAASPPEAPGFGYLATVLLISQLGCILAPTLLLAYLLTHSPRKTFLLQKAPSWRQIGLAVLLALVFHPLGRQLSLWIAQLYPMSEGVQAQAMEFARLLGDAPYPWIGVLMIAVLPAICEELAFRGFVLSGLRKAATSPEAVVLTAIAFGATHTLLQQSISAAAVGVVIGVLAVKTGSLWPCMAFHGAYNALQLLSVQYWVPMRDLADQWGARGLVFREFEGEQLGYGPLIVILGSVAALFVLSRIGRHPSDSAPRREPCTA